MTVSETMIKQVSPFEVDVDFTTVDYTQYKTWDALELDQIDPGLDTATYDYCHALLICHFYECSRGSSAEFKSEKIGDYCLCPSAEALTREGWRGYKELKEGDEILGYDPKTECLKWTKILFVYHTEYEGKMLKLQSGKKHITLDTMATPNHRWYVKPLHRIAKWKMRIHTSNELNSWDRIPLAAPYNDLGIKSKWSVEFVECVGWFVTEGHFQKGRGRRYAAFISQNETANYKNCQRIRTCLTKLLGGVPPEHNHKNGNIGFYIGAKTELYKQLCIVCPNKQLNMNFINELTSKQLKLLWEVMLLGDGDKGRSRFYQKKGETLESFQALSVLCGYGTYMSKKDKRESDGDAVFSLSCLKKIYRGVRKSWKGWVEYSGKVWCPTTELGTWVARDNGFTFITGNSYTRFEGAQTELTSYYNRVMQILAQFGTEQATAGVERDDSDDTFPKEKFKLDQGAKVIFE